MLNNYLTNQIIYNICSAIYIYIQQNYNIKIDLLYRQYNIKYLFIANRLINILNF